MWVGTRAGASDPAADFYSLDAKGIRLFGGNAQFPAPPGGAGRDVIFVGRPMAGKTLKAPSAQLQKDFQALQTDMQTLQSEIPTSLTAAVKADGEVIRKAFSSLTPTQMKALLPSAPPSSTSTEDPTARLTATLTTAGVSSSEINTITTDQQNLQNALTTTDPTLQAKIAADKAAIVKDGGPSMPDNGPGGGPLGIFQTDGGRDHYMVR
jgi:hypothetical protein